MGINCGSQIVLCDMPIHMDTYEGCSHACKYCFARRNREIDVIAPQNCIKQLASFVEGARPKNLAWCDWDIPLHWGGMSDPFQPCERTHKISYSALKILAATKYPFVVSTKGALIAEEEYLSLIRECNAVVQISMACSSYDALEPGAPTYEERLEICRKVAPNCKRLIARIQPYFTDCYDEIVATFPRLKEAGVYGITVEGMKFTKRQHGLVRLAGDYVYRKDTLKRHFEKMKKAAHEAGLAFYCAENRLRCMGDDMTCCGCAGVEGFRINKFNLEHLYNGEDVRPTEAMQRAGSGVGLKGLFQDAGSNKFLESHSMAEMMTSFNLFNSFEHVILGEDALKRENATEESKKKRYLRIFAKNGIYKGSE